jgi:hypothetical protein
MHTQKSSRAIIWVETGLKLIFSLGLLVVLVYWSSTAIIKYASEPISTQTQYLFGDDNLGNISLPLVTLCPIDIFEMAKNHSICGAGKATFLDVLTECLEQDPQMTLKPILKQFEIRREQLNANIS